MYKIVDNVDNSENRQKYGKCAVNKNVCNYLEPCEIAGKSANHVCMKEHFSMQFHMARNHIEM